MAAMVVMESNSVSSYCKWPNMNVKLPTVTWKYAIFILINTANMKKHNSYVEISAKVELETSYRKLVPIGERNKHVHKETHASHCILCV